MSNKLKPVLIKKSDLKLGESIQAKTISEIKLKDAPNRDIVTIDCMEMFGFLPQYILVAKVRGKSSMFNISGMRKVQMDLKAVEKSKLGVKKPRNLVVDKRESKSL